MNIMILADYRKEFRVNTDGSVVASNRAVARICNVSDMAIRRNLNTPDSKLYQTSTP